MLWDPWQPSRIFLKSLESLIEGKKTFIYLLFSVFRLDESLGEIRALEEANADLKFQLDRTQKQLILTEQNESEMKIYHNKLSAAEIRLDEVQKALEETTEELDIARSETRQWRVRADERQQNINGINLEKRTSY
jgi:chromosome segregation ATPase